MPEFWFFRKNFQISTKTSVFDLQNFPSRCKHLEKEFAGKRWFSENSINGQACRFFSSALYFANVTLFLSGTYAGKVSNHCCVSGCLCQIERRLADGVFGIGICSVGNEEFGYINVSHLCWGLPTLGSNFRERMDWTFQPSFPRQLPDNSG